MSLMARREGFDLPFRIAEDAECFQCIQDFIVPPRSRGLGALTTGIRRFEWLFSHLELTQRRDGRRNLIICGKIKQSCPNEHLHLAQLYVVAVIQQIWGLAMRDGAFVFNRLEVSWFEGLAHLKNERFAELVASDGDNFVASTGRPIPECPYIL